MPNEDGRQATSAPNDNSQSKPRGRTVPIPETVTKVKGYGTLSLYRMDASPFWYVRFYENGKIYRGSTKKTDKREAEKFAKEFFGRIKTQHLNTLPLTKRSGFEVCARGLHKENEARFARGEISATKIEYDSARLENDLMPFFGKMEIAEIDYGRLQGYLGDLTKRGLSTNSLKIHLSHIKTILKYAQKMNVVQYLPAFPSLKTIDKPRGWFSSHEYNVLHNTARANVGKSFPLSNVAGESHRKVTITDEIYDLILFMTNTFIRPTDIRILRHKHVAIVRSGDGYLRLSHPPTKGHASPIVSMPAAIAVYERLLAPNKDSGFAGEDDFLFQPQYQNRTYAMRQLHRQFDRKRCRGPTYQFGR
jgi:hypothetical protein